jgi:predicted neutral ceramidase superfamily lipid hydrolase
MSIKQYSIELLGVLATVFGAFFMNAIILNIDGGRTYEGYQMVYFELMVFCAWYTVVCLLISIAHPKPSKFRLLIIGVLVATVLILSSQGWIDPSIYFLSRINSWFIGYAQYIVVIPVFFLWLACSLKNMHMRKANTLNQAFQQIQSLTRLLR